MEYFKRLINNWIICPLQAVLDPSSRVPGSLSDRWSSLTTIYPLRFHEIFGRWLSYNIKRQNQTSVSVFQQNNLINALI